MVSNTVKMDQKEVDRGAQALEGRSHSDDPEYKKLRKDLPKEWPI